ncbi:DUF1178 family protein [Sphingomonas profundi]|uniref:DUF1178 family protein n=1 Tax=Alterirhizorhabdus profundi TaxID=2681549 RepID=UPI0012E8E3FB|nr:DUF1178 family protein [Sphingomonas profundi]
MIVFDLACATGGHVFEAWFGSTDDYDAQRARGLVSCPICGGGDVAKAVMAPNVAPKGNSRAVVRSAGATAPEPSPEAMKAFMTKLARAQSKALEGSDYVGDRFAGEARAIHHGEAEQRPIHGVATPVEAKGLIEDGVSIAPLPFAVRPPRSDN